MNEQYACLNCGHKVLRSDTQVSEVSSWICSNKDCVHSNAPLVLHDPEEPEWAECVARMDYICKKCSSPVQYVDSSTSTKFGWTCTGNCVHSGCVEYCSIVPYWVQVLGKDADEDQCEDHVQLDELGVGETEEAGETTSLTKEDIQAAITASLKEYSIWLWDKIRTVLLVVGILMLVSGYLSRDSTDSSMFQRSGMKMHVDSLTGCEYLSTVDGGALIKREDMDGRWR